MKKCARLVFILKQTIKKVIRIKKVYVVFIDNEKALVQLIVRKCGSIWYKHESAATR